MYDLITAKNVHPRRRAIIDSTGSYTYDQLMDHSVRIAKLLLNGQSDLNEQRIAFLLRPSFQYVCVQWGIWRAGGIAVPLGTTHPARELAYVVDDADVSMIVVESALADRVTEVAKARSMRLLSIDGEPAVPTDTALPELESSQRGMILYTSGSTGRPKGVVTTHGNINAQVNSLVEAWDWQPDDHILNVLPLHHIHGIINVLCCALRVGATCELMDFDPLAIWERFAKQDLTLFMAVPTIYAKLIATFEAGTQEQQTRWTAGAKGMRLMVSGSAALPVPTLEKWESITGQRLLERYGMTEIGMALSNPYRGTRRAGHVGKPLPGVEIRRCDDHGGLVDDATPGEIEVRGENVFSEYWNRPDATAASFRDGWFRTGDIAVVEGGDYRMLGRSSFDIIKTGGYKVSALEIEDVLRTYLPILDCAVVGVPDEEWGERVAACVVCRPGQHFELEDLRQWGKEQLAIYKVPSLLRLVDTLPRNAMGKVQKPIVREMFVN